MKTQVNARQLTKALSIITKSTIQTPSNPLYRYAQLDAHNGHVRIARSDMYVTSWYLLDSQTETPGTCSFDPQEALQLASSFPDGTVGIECEDGQVRLTTDTGRYELRRYDRDEQLDLNIHVQETPPTWSSNGKPLLDALRRVMIASDKKRIVPSSFSVQWFLDGHQLEVAATDSKQLAIVRVPVHATSETANETFRIDPENVKSLRRFLEASTGEVQCLVSKTHATFTVGRATIRLPFSESTFSRDYRSVIPKHPKYRVTIEPNYLLAAVKRILLTIDETDECHTTRLKFEASRVTVENVGVAREHVMLPHRNDQEFQFLINGKMLANALTTCGKITTTLEFHRHDRPVVWKANDVTYAVMPLLEPQIRV